MLCLNCGNIPKRNVYVYCSNACQMDYKYKKFIEKWKSNEVTGSRGIATKNISAHIVRYLRSKYGASCTICSWDKINQYTGRVPLEIDHIDGDSENNSESNLRLICPNCHSLTKSFRNLNKGKGRSWRRTKYTKNI